MKITIEIEKDAEIKKIEKFLKNLKPAVLQAKHLRKSVKIKRFLAFIQMHPISVDRIVIPDREERNAR
ncbi:MAG: hypothetical protein HY096_11955 [Nitrospinae bacterium]|nr:hypothetical protein [Nitrospinota bacterium]